jgi:signal transduction histidine kinase
LVEFRIPVNLAAMRDRSSTPLVFPESTFHKLPHLLVDSIILDQKLDILVISQNISDLLEFSHEEIVKKNINYLAGSEDLACKIKHDTRNGCFDEKVAILFSKTRQPVQVGISGFLLPSADGVPGHIFLRIRNVQDVQRLHQQLQKKAGDLDKFIYRTAHDLRGPLATIKGLINLLKIRDDNDEIDRFILLLDAHANKLDERLFQLTYLAQPDAAKAGQVSHSYESLETNLRKIIEQNSFVDFFEFHYSAPPEKIAEIDDYMLSSLLSNVLLYFLTLQMSTTHVQLFFRLFMEENMLNITIAGQGFETTPSLRSAIQQSESVYTDIIHYPQLMNFYAAQKLANQLRTRMNVHFLGSDNQRVTISIPFGQTMRG